VGSSESFHVVFVALIFGASHQLGELVIRIA